MMHGPINIETGVSNSIPVRPGFLDLYNGKPSHYAVFYTELLRKMAVRFVIISENSDHKTHETSVSLVAGNSHGKRNSFPVSVKFTSSYL